LPADVAQSIGDQHVKKGVLVKQGNVNDESSALRKPFQARAPTCLS